MGDCNDKHNEWAASLELKRSARDAQRSADVERLKQLGGMPRSTEEETEFLELLVRHSFSRAYFESRSWERTAA